MNTRALALATALAGIALGACSAATESVELGFTAICFPTKDCTFAATCDQQLMGSPAIDVSVARSLWVAVQMDNRLPNNADATVGRVNTNDAHVTSFEITYTDFPLSSVVQLTQQRIPAAGTTTVQLYVVPPQALPIAAPAASTQSVAHVRAKGYYDNGSSFETGEFPVAFRYCSGCVGSISCPAGTAPVVTCGVPGTQPVAEECQ
jgi:hypothetical protein